MIIYWKQFENFEFLNTVLVLRNSEELVKVRRTGPAFYVETIDENVVVLTMVDAEGREKSRLRLRQRHC